MATGSGVAASLNAGAPTASRAAVQCTVAVRPAHPGVIAQAIARAGRDGVICVESGVYHVEAPLQPLAGQAIVGQGMPVIDGAVPLGPWHRAAGGWWAVGRLPSQRPPDHNCLIPGCSAPQDVTENGRLLRRVLDPRRLTAGAYWEDYVHDRVWLGGSPAGAVVEQNFAPQIIYSHAPSVTLSGLIVEGAADPAQIGAIGSDRGRSGWRLDRLEVRLNHGTGVELDGAAVTRSHIHDNGQLGIGSAGDGPGGVVRGNEIDHNNTAGYDPEWEAGGGKWALNGAGLLVQGNYVHDNRGVGLWCDVNCRDVRFVGNRIERNVWYPPSGRHGAGILYEISYRGVIAGNTLRDNDPGTSNSGSAIYAGANIVIADSVGVTVSGNRVMGADGIAVLQQDRSTDPAAFGPHVVARVRIERNDIRQTGPGVVAGMAEDLGRPGLFELVRVLYDFNTYRHAGGSAWAWFDRQLGWEAWQAAGQDRHGRLLP